jgi:hypothetical protein
LAPAASNRARVAAPIPDADPVIAITFMEPPYPL